MQIKPNKPTTLPRFSLAQPVSSSFKTSTPFWAEIVLSSLPSAFDSDDLPNVCVFSRLLHRENPHQQKQFPSPNSTACPDTSFSGKPLLTFELVTDEFVLKIINCAPTKSCELDPIPTTLLYENLEILLPTITNIINTSLTIGIVSRDLKTAIVKPLSKKPSFDKILLKNYRPISNLPFLSKILEEIVLHKLLPSPRKQSQQPLSVSLSSRTHNRDRFVTYCKRYSLLSGQ